jgi:G3E family GTPase
VSSLEQLLERADEIDYVLLEGSGMADSEGIMMTFLRPRYKNLLLLNSISCIIDVEALFEHSDNEPLNMLKLRQIGFADMFLLNKTDLVSREYVEAARDWINLQWQRVIVSNPNQIVTGYIVEKILIAYGCSWRSTTR